MAVERASGDAVHSVAREAGHRVDERESGRELRPAPHARAKTLALRRGSRGEKSPVVMVRHASRTHRSTVNACGDDPDEEHAIEAGIPRVECARVDISLDCEGGNYRRGHRIKVARGS